MRVTIEGPTGVLLDTGDGENALVPHGENERAQAFAALMGALALLSGITQPASSSATAGGTDARSQGTARCPSAHTSGVVVRLSEQPARPARSSTLEQLGPAQTRC